MNFVLGAVTAVGLLFVIVATSDIDTIGSVTKRGFYTYDGELYVVRPATPDEVTP